MDGALRHAERRARAFDVDRRVVVHGDPHPGNALRVPAGRAGSGSGFVFVDPDGFLADPGYDLGVVLRGWCGELTAGDPAALARRYCRLLAGRTGVEEDAVWEWASSNASRPACTSWNWAPATSPAPTSRRRNSCCSASWRRSVRRNASDAVGPTGACGATPANRPAGAP